MTTMVISFTVSVALAEVNTSSVSPGDSERTSARAKENTPTWLEEVPSRRDRGIGSGTEHPNLWTQRQAPGEGGIDSRPAALVRETDRHGNGAARGVCSGRAGRRDDRVGTEQSEFPQTPTGFDGKGPLHDSDPEATPLSSTGYVAGGPALERTARGPLHYSFRLPKWCSW